jgi:hypothetical protein
MDPEFLSVAEVARLFHCHPVTVKRRARRDKLPAFKFGCRWFFPASGPAAAPDPGCLQCMWPRRWPSTTDKLRESAPSHPATSGAGVSVSSEII